jgi:hypothetical protein
VSLCSVLGPLSVNVENIYFGGLTWVLWCVVGGVGGVCVFGVWFCRQVSCFFRQGCVSGIAAGLLGKAPGFAHRCCSLLSQSAGMSASKLD